MYFFINKGRATLYKTASIYEAKRFFFERVRNKRAVDGRRLMLGVRLEMINKTITMKGS